MAQREPRDPEHHEYTGTGTTRSSDSSGIQQESASSDEDGGSSAAVVGATTSSHPAEADGLAINRSGSGGSGDEQNDEGSEPPAA